MPRQPACTQASTPATGSCSTIGTQSAVRIASTTPGVAGDQRVGVGDGVVQAERAAPPVGRADHADPGAVHLAGEYEVLQARAEAGRQPAPVLEHAPGSSPTLRLRFRVA